MVTITWHDPLEKLCKRGPCALLLENEYANMIDGFSAEMRRGAHAAVKRLRKGEAQPATFHADGILYEVRLL